jgi:tetratricopeptide (TPR) repeat protein
VFRSNEDSYVSCSDQNPFGIWYHDDDLSDDIQYEMRNRLNRSFTHFRIFNDLFEFITYLTRPLVVTKIFFIITGKNAQYLCTTVANRPQREKVYPFEPTSSLDNHPLVFTDMNQLFVQISEDIKLFLDKNQSPSATESSSTGCRESVIPPPWSVWNSKIIENSFRYWKKQSPEFFLFQTLSRILTRMKCDHDKSLAEMIAECRLHYIGDKTEVHKIDKVKANYKADDAILHYTEDSFLFRLLGRAFRSEDFERIFIFRRYIIDLHWQIDKIIKEQEILLKIRPLYRGKKLRTTVLQQLQDNIGSLISMNGFLSTTYNRDTALEVFAGAGQDRPDYKSVLFQFCVDEKTITRTYADISWISQYPLEEEVLFTIGSIWRIDSVHKNEDLWWTITLSSCNDDNLQLVEFFENLADDSTLLILGDVLRQLGQHTKAESFYNKMLNEPTVKDETRAILYYNIAMINMEQGKDSVASEHFHKAEKLIPTREMNTESLIPQPSYSSTSVLSSHDIYNNMGISYKKLHDSEKALEYFTKALNDNKSDRIDKAAVHDNIGLLLYSEGQYENALKHLLLAVELAQDHSSLPKFKLHYDTVKKHSLPKNASSIVKIID